MTYEVVSESGLAANEADEAVEFHIAFNYREVVVIDVFDSKSVAHDHQDAVPPFQIASISSNIKVKQLLTSA